MKKLIITDENNRTAKSSQRSTGVHVTYTVTRDVLKWLDPKSIAESVEDEIRAFRKMKKVA